MENHECKYEREWGKQIEATVTIEKAVDDIRHCTAEIKKAVNGMVTQVALNQQALRRAWFFIGGISLAVIVTAIKEWFFA